MDFEIKAVCTECEHEAHIEMDMQNSECPSCKEGRMVAEEHIDEPDDDPVWADSDALASAGWGTDEDYGG